LLEITIMIIVDTCSWLKIQLIYDKLKVDLRNMFQEFEILSTHQLNDELKYYLKEFIDSTIFQIHPINQDDMDQFKTLGFDLADASIIILSKEKKAFVITEDGELLVFLINSNIKAIQLAEFFLALLNLDKIEKRECYNLIKFLREQKNIKENKHKKLKAKLQELR